MSLPSVYNTKKGGKIRASSQGSRSDRSDPSPYAPKNARYSEPTSSDLKQRLEEDDDSSLDDYPRSVPETRLDQLLHTLGSALDSESTLNRSKWIVDPGNGGLLRMSSVVPPFPSDMTYAPGVFGNVVARELSSTEPRPPVAPATDYLYQAAVDLPQDGGPSLVKDIERDFQRRLSSLEMRHRVYAARGADRVDHVEQISTEFDERTKSCVARSTLAHLLYERKCRVQASVASRRLQELLFECLGEIEKACLRSSLLADTLCENVVVQKSQVESSTLWREFLLRAEEDAQQQLDLSSVEKKSSGFDACSLEIREALIASRYVPEEAEIRVRKIVCVRPGRTLPQSRRRSKDTRRRVSRLHHEIDEVSSLLSSLNAEYGRLGSGSGKRRKSKSGAKEGEEGEEEEDKSKNKEGRLRHGDVKFGRLPLFPSVVLLSSSTIKWLLPLNGCSVNTTLYYCLEERERTRGGSSGGSSGGGLATKSKEGGVSGATYSRVQSTISRTLHEMYGNDVVDSNGSGSRHGRGGSGEIVGLCGDHRREGVQSDSSNLNFDEKMLFTQFLSSHPDVLRVKEGSNVGSKEERHYAPATVHHLLETKMCHDLCQRLDSEGRGKLKMHYPDALRDANLTLYYVNADASGSNTSSGSSNSGSSNSSSRKGLSHPSPLVGCMMSVVEPTALRELCGIYAVTGEEEDSNVGNSRSKVQELPTSMSIFGSERASGGGGDQRKDDSHRRLSYFVLHNPTTRSVQSCLEKLAAKTRKKRGLARKQDCYMGLVEKERVAAVEYSKNKPIPGSRSRSKSKESEEEATGSTVPCVALLVGVELPHRSSKGESGEGREGGEGDAEKKEERLKLEDKTATTSTVDKVTTSDQSKIEKKIITGLSVGSFCRWRGCLCKGTKIPVLSSGKQSKHALCSLHSILRSFLEGCGAKEELSRHLPSNKNMKTVLAKKGLKGPQTEIAVEFLRITATSALLQELLGGKLAATIRAFCRRAAADAKTSRPETKTSPTSPPISPTRDHDNDTAMRENERQRRGLTSDVSLSQQVYATESDVAEELRRLCSLGVFPKAELQTIRETYNELDRERIRLLSKSDGSSGGSGGGGGEEELEPSTEERAARTRTEGQLELEFCKRKLAILRGRRQELELNLAKGIDVRSGASGTKSTSSASSLVELGGSTLSGDSGSGSSSRHLPPPTTLVEHESMSERERAIIIAAAAEVDKVASEQEAQKSLARTRLQDARQFSKSHYGKSTVEELSKKKKDAIHKKNSKKNVDPGKRKKSVYR